MNEEIDVEILRVLCDYSLELVRLRHSECKHLATENAGAETLRNVIASYRGHAWQVHLDHDGKPVTVSSV